ncbi:MULTISPECIES: hypothetical protein [unclassified Mesorhizobium]|uniref:hypothetical protein n=1 Tax=unclassified Mesorhizobium TaxID=325217 RepID=UPI0003D01A3F|nr:hypothetical protein [Mesorhizobium sp. L103C105A0]ESZ76701.1 hypothetical protein X726_06420 [Mesorhizobium sp. L103C105A0]
MGRSFPTTDHVDAGYLEEAVAWFAEHQTTCERPFVPAIRRRFGLSALDAVSVMRLANLRLDWPNTSDEEAAYVAS